VVLGRKLGGLRTAWGKVINSIRSSRHCPNLLSPPFLHSLRPSPLLYSTLVWSEAERRRRLDGREQDCNTTSTWGLEKTRRWHVAEKRHFLLPHISPISLPIWFGYSWTDRRLDWKTLSLSVTLTSNSLTLSLSSAHSIGMHTCKSDLPILSPRIYIIRNSVLFDFLPYVHICGLKGWTHGVYLLQYLVNSNRCCNTKLIFTIKQIIRKLSWL